jgi:hypothetical protein
MNRLVLNGIRFLNDSAARVHILASGHGGGTIGCRPAVMLMPGVILNGQSDVCNFNGSPTEVFAGQPVGAGANIAWLTA